MPISTYNVSSSQLVATFQQYLHSLKLTVHLSPMNAFMVYAAGSAIAAGAFLMLELVVIMGWSSRQEMPQRRKVGGPWRVSVIVPTYREGEAVLRAVRSVVSQDYPKELLEVIIAGEASDPTLAPALNSLGLKAEDGYVGAVDGVRVKVSLGEGLGGKPVALNRALYYASGDIIGVLDADGELPRDAVPRAVSVLEQGYAAAQLPREVRVPERAVKGLRYAYVRGQRAEMEFYNRLLAPALMNLTGSVWLTGSGYFIWRSDLEDVGAWTSLAPTEDLDLSAKLLASGRRIALLPGAPLAEEALVNFRSVLRQKERWVRGSMLAMFTALRNPRRTWPLLLFFSMPAWGYLLTPWLGIMGLALMNPALLKWTLLWSVAWMGPALAYYIMSLRRAGTRLRPLPAIIGVYLMAGVAALVKLFLARYDWKGSRA